MNVATTDTHLTIEDLLHGYESLINDMDMFYEKLGAQSVFNIIQEFRYNRVQKDRISKVYGPPIFPDDYEITYQDFNNLLNPYEEFCKDMKKKFNKVIADNFYKINDNARTVTCKHFITQVLDKYDLAANKTNLSRVYDYILQYFKDSYKKQNGNYHPFLTGNIESNIGVNKYSINAFVEFVVDFFTFIIFNTGLGRFIATKDMIFEKTTGPKNVIDKFFELYSPSGDFDHIIGPLKTNLLPILQSSSIDSGDDFFTGPSKFTNVIFGYAFDCDPGTEKESKYKKEIFDYFSQYKNDGVPIFEESHINFFTQCLDLARTEGEEDIGSLKRKKRSSKKRKNKQTGKKRKDKKRTGKKPIRRRRKSVSKSRNPKKEKFTGGYYDVDEIKELFNDMDIVHNSLTIDTLLLYDRVFTKKESWYTTKDNTRYKFAKMVEDFFTQYYERITTDLTQFKANCDEVTKKLNEYELNKYIENPDIFPGVTASYFNHIIKTTVKTNVDETIKELDRLKGLNFDFDETSMLRSLPNPNNLKLKDQRWEVNMGKQIYNLIKSVEEIFGEYYRSGASPVRVSGVDNPDTPLYEGRDLNNLLRRLNDYFFAIQNIVVSTMKRYTMIIKEIHDLVMTRKTITPELTSQIRIWLLMLVHCERILSLYNDPLYASDEYSEEFGGLLSIEVTYSNMNIERNNDFRLFIGEIYQKLERVDDDISRQKSMIHQNQEYVSRRQAIANRDLTPDIQQRYDDDTGEVIADVVSKDRFYNELLPGTRVKEINPESRHICIKKSSDWTEEKPKYLMMNLKTKEKKEIEHTNKDLKPGSKIALVVLNEWEVLDKVEDSWGQETTGDRYRMRSLRPGSNEVAIKVFPSPNLEIDDSQMRNNVNETIRMNTNQRIWQTEDAIEDDVHDLGLRPEREGERNRARAIENRINETR